ncbi:hypothetical protein GOBAR_AA17459 [Gossypium barbadense]|uniref:Uncharacterized protein n=1 Tax=Gossypium barbadense TaxID=3634 RepID=A0A2P5XIN8_GOSBA|nr:hypothetical protein GOBAR_AA17459 [Gossypium barbadense]
MAEKSFPLLQHGNKDVFFSDSGVKIVECSFSLKRVSLKANGFFASVNQAGMGFAISPNPQIPLQSTAKFHFASLVSISEPGYLVLDDELEIAERKLMSGAVAGAVSRTAVAPLETIKTHLMVGSCGNSMAEVFDNITMSEGWKGLFRGNLVNVIRVAPSKAIELFAYETVKKQLTPEHGEHPKLPLPASFIAGAVAGVSSTLLTYPLELLKTRLTVNEDYKNLLDAVAKIVQAEGPGGLYKGLTPSVMGVVPYAASNYFAYDTLRNAYKKAFKKEEIGNVMTLLIGSAAGAISSTATYPLEVARKQMQAGAINGRQCHSMIQALTSIVEKEGMAGLYRGLGPSCMKLVPAAGISFMCYEACKRILAESEEKTV